MCSTQRCNLAKGFSICEKAWAQLTFLGMGIIGMTGIVLYDWKLMIPYVIVYFYGIFGVIVRHTNCPRCPHFHVYGDCLQAPVFLIKWILKGVDRKYTPFSGLEKFLFFLIFITIPVYPIYFLVAVANTSLMVSYFICAAMWYGGQFFYFCKSCRVKQCPFNRAMSAENTKIATVTK